jgi:hypothetical protein
MQLRLHAEYECHPLWTWEADGLRNFDPQKLPIPAAMVEDIRAWARRYEATYNRADPVSSGFLSPAEEEDFDREGRRLWSELKEALGPEHQVAYYSVLTGWEGDGARL